MIVDKPDDLSLADSVRNLMITLLNSEQKMVAGKIVIGQLK